MAKNKAKVNKFVTGAVTAAMVATAVVPVAAAATDSKFTDIGGYDKATQDKINALNAAGIVNGTSDTTFSPTLDIKRGQVVKLLSRYLVESGIAQVPADWKTKERFSDVPVTSTDQDLVESAAVVFDAGVFEGNNGVLNTSGTISRQNMAVVLDRAAKAITGASLQTIAGDKTNNVADLNKAKADAQGAIKALNALGISTVENFNPLGNVKRVHFVTFLSNAIDVIAAQAPVAPEVVSVSAINATSAKVNFKGAVQQGVDFSNFDIDGGATVTDVTFSADRKSATITVNPEFVRNQEYTVSVFGVMDADNNEYAETKGKFTWEVAEGVVVALGSTTLDQGQTVELTVKDAGGKDVKDAEVTVTSLNTNLVTVTQTPTNSPKDVKVTANNNKLAGTTDVLVKTELPDGSILNNTFKVTVKEAVTTVANAGYTLANVTPVALTATPFANTLSFKSYGKSVTSLVEGSGAKELVAFAETNGNPDVTHLDFTDAKVTSSNAIVATAVVAGDKINVTPLKAGSTTIQVTMEDGSRKSFPITVTAEQVITDLYVSETTVNLSDQNRTEALLADGKTGQDGVDAKEIEVETLDQYKNVFGTAAGKVTVTSSTDGVKLFDVKAGTTEYVTGSNELTITSGADSFYIQAQKDKPVKNAKVTVSYFKNKTDTKPAITKTITVNVAKIDPTAKTSDIDVVAGNEIDANALNITSAVNTINFATEVYALDSKGNRLENISVGETNAGATVATLDPNNKEADNYVDATTSVISFDDVNDALTYLRASSTVNVTVKVTETAGPSDTEAVTKVIPVTYKNSAIVPNKVTVATSPIAIKMAAGTITYDEIIFGKFDTDQLIKDDAELFDLTKTHSTHYVTTLKTAKNAGYEYNKSIISVLGTDGKAMNIGAGLYGNLAAQDNGNIWFTKAIEDMVNKSTKFATGSQEFEYEFAIANVSGDVTPGASDVTLTAGQSSTFTLVLSGVYVKDSVISIETVGGGGAFADATTAQKAKHNLLAAPVQLNVSVSAE